MIEKVQRYFTKRIFAQSGHMDLSYNDRLAALNGQTPEHRRASRDLQLTYKITHGLSPLKMEDFEFEFRITITPQKVIRFDYLN
jgi:hypothetical protein